MPGAVTTAWESDEASITVNNMKRLVNIIYSCLFSFLHKIQPSDDAHRKEIFRVTSSGLYLRDNPEDHGVEQIYCFNVDKPLNDSHKFGSKAYGDSERLNKTCTRAKFWISFYFSFFFNLFHQFSLQSMWINSNIKPYAIRNVYITPNWWYANNPPRFNTQTGNTDQRFDGTVSFSSGSASIVELSALPVSSGLVIFDVLFVIPPSILIFFFKLDFSYLILGVTSLELSFSFAVVWTLFFLTPFSYSTSFFFFFLINIWLLLSV